MDPSARIGTTIHGKWRIERLLGTGGFASVYAATHRAGKRVALKVLHPALSASGEVRRRFLKEAYAANSIDHPGVVGVSDDDVTEDGCAFLVMDLLDGESVDARRKRAGGRLGLEDTLLLAEQSLDVIAAAHDKGIVHRDLKPENLFWTTNGQIRVLDFGIARFREPGDESTSTQTGMTMGSPAFMAPEQARGRWSEVDARTDVYAMGATMFTLLTGQLVHGKLNTNESLIAAATTPAPRLATLLPNIPASVADVVDRALAFDKASRWDSARAMAAVVRTARSHIGILGSSTLPLSPAPGLTLGAAMGLSVAQQTTPLGTGPQAPAMKAPVTEIAPPGALPLQSTSASAPVVAPSMTEGPARENGSQGSTPSAVVTTQPPKRKAPAVAIAGGALFLVGVVAVLLWLSQRSQATSAPERSVPVADTTAQLTADVPVVTAAPTTTAPEPPPSPTSTDPPSLNTAPVTKPTGTAPVISSPVKTSTLPPSATPKPPPTPAPTATPAKTKDPLTDRPRTSKSTGK